MSRLLCLILLVALPLSACGGEATPPPVAALPVAVATTVPPTTTTSLDADALYMLLVREKAPELDRIPDASLVEFGGLVCGMAADGLSVDISVFLVADSLKILEDADIAVSAFTAPAIVSSALAALC